MTMKTVRGTNSNDRAEILTLIHSRRPVVEPAMAVESRQLTISLGEDFAFSDGLVCVSGVKPESEGSARIWMRETMCFERCKDGWRIVHQDTTAPFCMDGSVRRESMAGSKLRVGWTAGGAGAGPCTERVQA